MIRTHDDRKGKDQSWEAEILGQHERTTLTISDVDHFGTFAATGWGRTEAESIANLALGLSALGAAVAEAARECQARRETAARGR